MSNNRDFEIHEDIPSKHIKIKHDAADPMLQNMMLCIKLL